MPSARLLGLALAGIVAAHPAAAQHKYDFENHALDVSGLAGQSVPVVTLGYVAADSTIVGDSVLAGWQSRAVAVPRFDAIFGPYLQDNASDVKWVLPDQLRKMYKRAPSVLPDPDRLGHSVMAGPKYKRIPYPLNARMRQLVAFSDGRDAVLPSALVFSRDSQGVAAELAVELVDATSGDVLWRTYATGRGRTPEAAVRAAIAIVVPPELGQ